MQSDYVRASILGPLINIVVSVTALIEHISWRRQFPSEKTNTVLSGRILADKYHMRSQDRRFNHIRCKSRVLDVLN